MTLREQVEALRARHRSVGAAFRIYCRTCDQDWPCEVVRLLDLIDAHRCRDNLTGDDIAWLLRDLQPPLDPERLARALVEGVAWNPLLVEAEAERIIAAYEEN